MADRKSLIAGNWKMNGLRADAAALAGELVQRATTQRLACDLLVCPPATMLCLVAEVVQGSPIAVGGQDCHAAPRGAFTGSISAEMLRDVGCTYAIVGHSERRHGNGETNSDVREKALAALHAGLTAVVCVGEMLAERESGRALDVVTRQVIGSIPEGATADKLVVAYEPVWAIGTGRTPTTHDIVNMHAAIRPHLPPHTRIL
ncbi:MAG: triose-phosphate isomerase, partial [Alphaproteobacteria bacterium]|nr:triose-phosphate isomerase [Alphaproteobacteria bacterium]